MMLRGVLSLYFAQLADPPIARLDLGERVVIGAESSVRVVVAGDSGVFDASSQAAPLSPTTGSTAMAAV